MNTGRLQEIESQGGLRKKTVPVRNGERRVDRVKDGNEMIFEF